MLVCLSAAGRRSAAEASDSSAISTAVDPAFGVARKTSPSSQNISMMSRPAAVAEGWIEAAGEQVNEFLTTERESWTKMIRARRRSFLKSGPPWRI
jgi:hypothetical protein